MAAMDRKHAAAAEAMTEAEGKYAELVEIKNTFEVRVSNVVAQLESEQGEVDRLQKEATAGAYTRPLLSST